MTNQAHTTAQDWLEIRLETTETHNTDVLEEALFAAGALSVTLTSKTDEVMLIEPTPGELPLWESGIIVTGLFAKGFDAADALPILTACLGEPLPLIASTALADRVWELEWTKHFKPIQFGQNLWVCPSNQKVPAKHITKNTQIITLDPGLAFGTGTHPTTAMALTDIATHGVRDNSVIDYGCGSGVLGIAALKMGAKHAVMTDIDPQALTTTRDNATINGVAERMSTCLPDAVPEQPTDFLIANILLEPLLNLKDTFVALCHDNTRILLTGLLNEQVDKILTHYADDFHDFHITRSGDWAMVIAKRKA